MTVLIDPKGEIWDAHARLLRQRYAVAVSDEQFADFLVRNYGFIAITRHRDSCAVSFNPASIAISAYAVSARRIEEMRPRRVALNWFDGQWHHEIVSSSATARSRLLHLFNRKHRPQHRYIAQPRDVATLDRLHPLRALLEVWTASSGPLKVEDCPNIISGGLGDRYVIVDGDGPDSAPMFDEIGPGLVIYDNGWQSRLKGLPVRAQPDLKYAQWISDVWQVALDRQEPTLFDSDVYVEDPRRDILKRLQYTRLTVPLGPTKLISATFSDHSVDLRVKTDHEPVDVIN